MTEEEKIKRAQGYLKERHLDGWLLYDFHRNNDLAHLFLNIPASRIATRRFFYWIPVQGKPIKLVHAIEAHMLDGVPGEKKIYSSWQSLEQHLGEILQGKKRIAMEFSPKNAIPYVSKVDGGTIDLVRSFHVEVVSSADFLLNFTSVIDEEQAKSHIRANRALLEILEGTWQLVGKLQLANEWDVQQHLLAEFKQRNLITDSPPIVGVNAHSADPHFETVQKGASPIRKGDFILIDLWAKEKGERAVFGDLTRVAVMASSPTPKQQEVFQAVRNGQKAAIALVKERFQAKKPIQGWEVDEAARSSIRKAGYGDYFTHRTGHNIEMHVHGSGTHMDNLEMHDVRPLLPMTCFSIEPGIYLPGEFGVRLETDLWITKDGKVEITGGEEDHLRCLLS